ncbi:MAG TPA: two pore domain potassium channel family protein [Gammaproteobacteria bacterium]|nr:two pore domain potassium channel family protein [Gammaproteobacteria bacterium]
MNIPMLSKENNFEYLTAGIVLLLFIATLVEQFPGIPGKHLVQAFSIITIVIGVYGFKSSAAWFRKPAGFIVATLALVAIGVMLERLQLYYLHLLLLLGFYLWAIWLAAKEVFFSGVVDMNRIIGAICVYLLMGLIWTTLYLFIAQAVPGAFNGLEQRAWYENFSEAAYYSFVTITTLGYGDITPVAPLARFLAYMEAVIGVFYMAILVASLIGLGINKAQKRNQ